MLTKSYLKKLQWVIIRLWTNSVNCQIAIKNCKIRRLRWMLIQSIFGPLRHQHWQPHRIVDNKTATLFMALGFTCGVGSRNPRRPFPHVQHWWQRSKIVASPWWTHWSSTSNKELTLQGRIQPYLDLPFKVLPRFNGIITSLMRFWSFIGHMFFRTAQVLLV